MKRILSIFLALCLCITMCGCSFQKKKGGDTSGSAVNALDEEEVLKQAGKILKKMTVDEKIGQMILIDLDELSENGKPVTKLTKKVKETIEKYHIGGVLLGKQNVVSVDQIQKLTQDLRSIEGITLYIGTEEEGGGSRSIAVDNKEIDGTGYVSPMDMGKNMSEDQLEDTGIMIAKELQNLGFNFNLAPCADVWKVENIGKVSWGQIRNLAMQEVGPAPAEPKIKKKMSKKKVKRLKRKYEKELASYEKKVQAYIDRYTVKDANQSCFSTDEDVVSTATEAIITGMKKQGVATATKTFPGVAPVARYHKLVSCEIQTGLSKLRRENFSTFSAAVDAGTNMIMVGHVWLTKIDKDLPASLSPTITSEVLRKELGFEGVLFTEALNLPVITNQYTSEEAELKAVMAGVDMLYNPVDVEDAIFHVSRAVMFGDINEKQIDQAVLRILQDKIQQGIYHK
ncbi:MAG: glycoside hydrolase family 3 N-terminal domain-containing protein [Eubacterium sp.]